MAIGLYVEIQLLCSIIFAILLYKILQSLDRSISQIYFSILLVSCIATFLFDAAQMSLSGDASELRIAGNYLFNVLYYISLGANGYVWFLYSESEQESALALERRWRVITAIPYIVLCILAILSPFTHVLFYINEEGFYTRGPLHFLQLIISYSYLLFTGLKCFYQSTKTNNYQRKQHLLITSSFLVPVLIAGVLQILVSDIPAICAGCTISLLFIYISMQEENISIDPLTHVNNRRRLIRHLQTLINKSQDEVEPFTLIILDLDRFKEINDLYGHVEGDRALIHVGRALLSMRQDNIRVYRYGGDEFVLLTGATKPEDLALISQNIQAQLEAECKRANTPYSLSASIGWASFDATITTPQTLIRRADEKLYEAKRKAASLNANQNGTS